MSIGTLPLVLISIPSLKEQNWSAVSLQVSRIGSARTALYENLIIVIAVAVAWLILSESMTLLQVLGMALVFTSLYLAGKNQQ